ncbi:MAG: peptidase dimerization domain-containing protein [Solirubrobacteraceae bacterium]
MALGNTLAGEGVNVGRMSGGGAVNAIASQAEMLVELRSVNDADLSGFEERLRALTVDPPLMLECEVVGRRGAGRIEPGHPLVRSVVGARRSLGLGEAFGAGSTDANAAAVLGIPAVGIGCADGAGMHTVHERIDLASLELGVRQLEAVLVAAAAAV